MERRKEGDTLTVGRQIMPLCKRWEIRREVEILISAPKVYANEVQSRNSRDTLAGDRFLFLKTFTALDQSFSSLSIIPNHSDSCETILVPWSCSTALSNEPALSSRLRRMLTSLTMYHHLLSSFFLVYPVFLRTLSLIHSGTILHAF